MFKNCKALIALYLHYFEIKEALRKENMFDGCSSLINKYFLNHDTKINNKKNSMSGSDNNKVSINESDDQKSSVFSNEKSTKVIQSNDETKDKGEVISGEKIEKGKSYNNESPSTKILIDSKDKNISNSNKTVQNNEKNTPKIIMIKNYHQIQKNLMISIKIMRIFQGQIKLKK